MHRLKKSKFFFFKKKFFWGGATPGPLASIKYIYLVKNIILLSCSLTTAHNFTKHKTKLKHISALCQLKHVQLLYSDMMQESQISFHDLKMSTEWAGPIIRSQIQLRSTILQVLMNDIFHLTVLQSWIWLRCSDKFSFIKIWHFLECTG